MDLQNGKTIRITLIWYKGSFSWGGAAATTFWIDPENELVAILMTQLMDNPYGFAGDFERLTYQSLINLNESEK